VTRTISHIEPDYKEHNLYLVWWKHPVSSQDLLATYTISLFNVKSRNHLFVNMDQW
jgi:hypothetical protein